MLSEFRSFFTTVALQSRVRDLRCNRGGGQSEPNDELPVDAKLRVET